MDKEGASFPRFVPLTGALCVDGFDRFSIRGQISGSPTVSTFQLQFGVRYSADGTKNSWGSATGVGSAIGGDELSGGEGWMNAQRISLTDGPLAQFGFIVTWASGSGEAGSHGAMADLLVQFDT